MSSARVLIEVVAGLTPERPDPGMTKRLAITNDEWEAAGDQWELLQARNAEAMKYAGALMNPNRVNWVRVDWIWL